jgi:hypothetical protein
MAALFATGYPIDAILLLVALEAVALALWHRASGRGVPIGRLAANLCAGAALLLAVRAALVGAWWGSVALWLAVSLVAHVADLRGRWRR